MIILSIVVDKTISGKDNEVDIGVSLPLEWVKGIFVHDASANVHRSPGDYTVTVVDDSHVNIEVGTGATDLADGDIVNIAAICRGEIARP